MNNPDDQIERTLRRAPQFQAPPSLKNQLIAELPTPAIDRSSTLPVGRGHSGFSPQRWLNQWWPALGAAALSLACGVLLAVQHFEIQELKKSLPKLSKPRQAIASPTTVEPATENTEPVSAEQQEIARLGQEAAALSSQIKRLEDLHAQNIKLRAQLAASAAVAVTPQEQEAMAKAREQALARDCVNNLKQLALAARVWALDNEDHVPSNVLQMTNEMSTPKILFCPADTGHTVASDWASFSAANCSYEYLAPGASDGEPMRVLFRCPVHGAVALIDGSVQMVGKDHPEWFEQRDGKLYLLKH